jgi:hypothetical protein
MSALPQPLTGKWAGKRRPNLEKLLDVVALMMKGPRTVPELAAAMQPCHQDTPYEYVRLMRDAGLLYVKEWRPVHSFNRSHVAVYAFQPTPYERPDAQKGRG